MHGSLEHRARPSAPHVAHTLQALRTSVPADDSELPASKMRVSDLDCGCQVGVLRRSLMHS